MLAYGLSEPAIAASGKGDNPLGEYTMIAASAGSVLSDDFSQGQRVTAGQRLMDIADESELWVEARLAPNANLALPPGTAAQVRVGNASYLAQVTQQGHTIDRTTRTRIVRLSVPNQAHQLHPGQFADVYFSFATGEPVLAVSEAALMRTSDGHWAVYVETGEGRFEQREVEVGRSLGKWREISGIAASTPVVVEGAFFVASQQAKSGFDPHAH